MASKQEIIEAIIKSNIGDVAEGLDKAAQSTEKLASATDKVDGGLKKAQGGVRSLGVGFKTLAKASGIIFLLNKAFEVFQDVMSKNQKATDLFKIAFNTLSIMFNDFFKFLESNIEPVTQYFKALFEDPGTKIREMGQAIKEGLIDRFNEFVEVLGLAGKALGELVTGKFSKAFDTIKEAGKQVVDVYTGVDDSFDKVKETIITTVASIKDYVSATTEQATALVESEKAANRAQAEFDKLNATYLKQAEELRQVRDDTTKTFAERIKANEDLNEVIKKQQALQREQIQTQIDYAQQQYDINGSEENWIALQQQKTALLSLEETITGQLSEQKTNSVALAQELIDAENELALVGKTARELELTELQQNYEAKLELARKAGQDTAAVDEEYRLAKGEINDRYDEEELAKAQEIADAKKEVAFAMLGAIADNLQQSLDEQADEIESNYEKEMKLAGDNVDEQDKINKKFDAKRKANAKKQKKLQVAMATIETFKSATAAFSSLAAIPVVGPVLGGIAAAAAVAAGLANIRKILKQDVGGGGGGGATESASTPSAAEAKPPAAEMMSGKFELGGALKPEPVKAFVVTDEMTNSQDQLDDIRRESTL
jgi:hypothetical protein